MTKTLLLTAILCGPFFSSRASAQSSPTSVDNLRNTIPYSYVGRITMRQDGGEYLGSGTVVKPYSVLTAGHNLYSQGTGWSTKVTFSRAYSSGTSASTASASKLYLLGGYSSAVNDGNDTSKYGFSRDSGGIICFSRPMAGSYVSCSTNSAYLTGTAYNMSLGYGAEIHSGEKMLRSAPRDAFIKIYNALYKNNSYGIEGGMSGGPVFAQTSSGKWVVCGVNVFGPEGTIRYGAGIRAVDTDTTLLIANKLQ